MRIGVDLMLWTGCYTRKELKLIDKVARLGFDGVEFPVFSPESVDVVRTRRALEDNALGATVCTVITKGSLIGSQARDRRAALNHLIEVLDVSKAFGAECVAGPLYSPVGRLLGRGPNAAEWKYAVEQLRKVADLAESLDIKVGIEPINRFETYFLNTVEDTLKLVKEIGSPNLGVHYDTFHANIEEKDPVAALRKVGKKWLTHVHTSENDRGIPGTGHVPWEATFKALNNMGYNGWLTIESFVPAIKELARAASIWRPLAKDGDDLARRGLKFLRGMLVGGEGSGLAPAKAPAERPAK
jgi:D-psicose/D-tagatose/L-ribulose 3-epimerase